MSQVLVIAEHAGGKLNVSTAKTVKAAASLAGAEIVVAVFTTAALDVTVDGGPRRSRRRRP